MYDYFLPDAAARRRRRFANLAARAPSPARKRLRSRGGDRDAALRRCPRLVQIEYGYVQKARGEDLEPNGPRHRVLAGCARGRYPSRARRASAEGAAREAACGGLPAVRQGAVLAAVSR
jgi:hypothetical protein